jgi:hypothetical protein
MKKVLILSLSMIVLIIIACTPRATAISAPLPSPTPSTAMETQTPIPVALTEVNPSTETKLYTNDLFGLSFQYPSSWYGPSQYVSDRSLRVEVGSDVVYPYGERPEQASSIKNSYSVVIQYTKNNQNSYWKDTYQTLLNLRDGESLSGARSLLIRVRQLNIGRFKGFEYITTLSETAQTDYFYTRSIMMFDEQTNDLMTIMGQPYNVEFNNGEEWREAYRTIDEANLTFFQKLVESITFEQ